jgi:hypothetical protein
MFFRIVSARYWNWTVSEHRRPKYELIMCKLVCQYPWAYFQKLPKSVRCFIYYGILPRICTCRCTTNKTYSIRITLRSLPVG